MNPQREWCSTAALASRLPPQLHTLIRLVLFLALSRAAHAADVEFYTGLKSQVYFQSWRDDAPSTADPFYSDLQVWVYPSADGVTGNFRRPNNPTIAVLSTDAEGLAFKSGKFTENEEFVTQYPDDVDFTLNLATPTDGSLSIPVRFSGDAYPVAPLLLNNYDYHTHIDAGRDFTLNWTAFTGASTNDCIRLVIFKGNNYDEGLVVLKTPPPGSPGALNGLARSYRIPAGTLTTNQDYGVFLTFANVTHVDDSSYPGAPGYIGYASGLWSVLLTNPTESRQRPLRVVINGSGKITPNYTNISLAIEHFYTIKALPGADYIFSHWSGEFLTTPVYTDRLTFYHFTNRTIQVDFIPNPFRSAAGSYNGLFFEPDAVRRESSGFTTAKVRDSGSFTASLQIAGKRQSISGQFDLAGMATNQIVRAGTNSLTVELQIDLDGGDRITGRVMDGEWIAELGADRAVFNSKTNPAEAFTGKYTLALPGADDAAASPGGTGNGALTVDAGGSVNFRGTLGDGTKVTQKVPLSRQGHWPVYLSLYRNRGSVLGWVTITNTPGEDMTGLLSWSKPANVGKPYTNGFSIETLLTGSRFTPPGTNLLFTTTNLMVIFTGGNLATSFTNRVVLGLNNKVINTSSNKLTLSLDTRNGLFTGKVTPPGRTKAIAFNGAILQKHGYGDGCFLGTNQSGRVYVGSGLGLTNPAPETNLVLSLDGDGDLVTIPSSPDLQNPDEITVEAWIYPQSPTDNPNHGYFILKGDGVSSRSYEIDWVVNGGNTGIGVGFECNLFTGTTALSILGVAAQETNWYHVAFSYKASSGEFKLYTNGVLAAQTTTDGQPLRQTTQDLKFGGVPLAQARGELDEVRIWIKARTQAEVQSDFACRLTGSEAGLAGYWTFDAGTASDQTGNGHHGTLSGDASIHAPIGADLIHQLCEP